MGMTVDAYQSLISTYNSKGKRFLEVAFSGSEECPFCGELIEWCDIQECGIPRTPVMCHCVEKFYSDAQDQRRIASNDAMYSSRLAKSRIPERFYTARTDEHVRSMYIYGPVGTGKTYLACALLMKEIRAGRSCLFITMGKVEGSQYEERESIIEEMRHVDVLCIDDLGKTELSEWAWSMAFRVIDERYGTGKKTIITSNSSLGELSRAVSQKSGEITSSAICSRIAEIAEMHKMDGENRRLGL